MSNVLMKIINWVYLFAICGFMVINREFGYMQCCQSDFCHWAQVQSSPVQARSVHVQTK